MAAVDSTGLSTVEQKGLTDPPSFLFWLAAAGKLIPNRVYAVGSERVLAHGADEAYVIAEADVLGVPYLLARWKPVATSAAEKIIPDAIAGL